MRKVVTNRSTSFDSFLDLGEGCKIRIFRQSFKKMCKPNKIPSFDKITQRTDFSGRAVLSRLDNSIHEVLATAAKSYRQGNEPFSKVRGGSCSSLETL